MPVLTLLSWCIALASASESSGSDTLPIFDWSGSGLPVEVVDVIEGFGTPFEGGDYIIATSPYLSLQGGEQGRLTFVNNDSGAAFAEFDGQEVFIMPGDLRAHFRHISPTERVLNTYDWANSRLYRDDLMQLLTMNFRGERDMQDEQSRLERRGLDIAREVKHALSSSSPAHTPISDFFSAFGRHISAWESSDGRRFQRVTGDIEADDEEGLSTLKQRLEMYSDFLRNLPGGDTLNTCERADHNTRSELSEAQRALMLVHELQNRVAAPHSIYDESPLRELSAPYGGGMYGTALFLHQMRQ